MKRRRSSLATRIARVCRLTQAEAADVLRVVAEHIDKRAKKGERVSFPDLGYFEMRTRKARTVVHPGTKETLRLPQMKRLYFRARKGVGV